MPGKHRITCIQKGKGTEPHEMITHVAGMTSTGRRWKISLADAIAGIRGGVWTFYVRIGGETVAVEIAGSERGKPYLKTSKDDAEPALLLKLPECWPLANLTDGMPEDPTPPQDPEGGTPGDSVAWP